MFVGLKSGKVNMQFKPWKADLEIFQKYSKIILAILELTENLHRVNN